MLMEPVDLEYGLSSMGVTEMREDGESKDCERWTRILGEGVLGGAGRRAAMSTRTLMLGIRGSKLRVYM